MKKILCTILILALIIPFGITAAHADTETEILEEDFFEYILTIYTTPDEIYSSHVTIRDCVQSGEVTIFTAWSWLAPADMPVIRVLDEWFVYSVDWNKPSAVGIYAKHNDKIYTLEDAWGKGIISDLSCIKDFKHKCVGLYGDADRNDKIDVKDATTIQKTIAGLNVNTEKDALTNILCDFHYDQSVNIKDATAIQKYIAGLEPMKKPLQENYGPLGL